MKKNQVILAVAAVAAVWFLFFRNRVSAQAGGSDALGGTFAPLGKGPGIFGQKPTPGAGGGGGLFGGGGGGISGGGGSSGGGLNDLLGLLGKGLKAAAAAASSLFKNSPGSSALPPGVPVPESFFKNDVTSTDLPLPQDGGANIPGLTDEFGTPIEFPAAQGGGGYNSDPLDPLSTVPNPANYVEQPQYQTGGGYDSFGTFGGQFYNSGPAPATFDAFSPAPAYSFFSPPPVPQYSTIPDTGGGGGGGGGFYYGSYDPNQGGAYGGVSADLNPLIPFEGGNY